MEAPRLRAPVQVAALRTGCRCASARPTRVQRSTSPAVKQVCNRALLIMLTGVSCTASLVLPMVRTCSDAAANAIYH